MHPTQNSQGMGRWMGLGGICRRMAVLCLLTAASAQAAVLHVDAASTAPAPDGASWATAYPDIQSAVDAAAAAAPGDEVWVRAGVYRGTTDPVLTLRVGVAVYGGFDGTESSRDQRYWAGRPTVLDGEGLRRCVRGASSADHLPPERTMSSTAAENPDEVVRVSREGEHIAIVQLNRPHARNAVSSALAVGLDRAVKAVE
ncbi:MAG TPA: hypothetical protein P5069_13315, partial [Candidatus Hydrogenedentes bacterium]|nr:hypothetical protein [Candidatus Hydrogenedentota bacterium]